MSVRTAAIFENLGAVLSNCADIQETIEIGRRTFPADESFTAVLDKLQEELDAKAAIMYEALTKLNGIEMKVHVDPETSPFRVPESEEPDESA